MPATLSYTRELEHLIQDILLPVFDRYYRERGLVPEYTKINPLLLKQIVCKKQTAALFLPPQLNTTAEKEIGVSYHGDP